MIWHQLMDKQEKSWKPLNNKLTRMDWSTLVVRYQMLRLSIQTTWSLSWSWKMESQLPSWMASRSKNISTHWPSKTTSISCVKKQRSQWTLKTFSKVNRSHTYQDVISSTPQLSPSLSLSSITSCLFQTLCLTSPRDLSLRSTLLPLSMIQN